MDESSYLDLKSLSKHSCLGVSTLRWHIKANGLPSFRVPGKNGNTGKVLVKIVEFDNWMERFRGSDYLDPEAVADDVIKSLSDI